jgi:peptidyl-prolyl cis-trans isomerase C/peptidyl-prolyl cis-trans isomerase SurA
MNSKVLAILGVTAITLTAAALLIDRSETSTTPAAQVSGEFFPDMASRVERASRIEMSNTGGQVSLVKNADGVWTIEQSGGYWANEDQVKKFLFGLGGMEVVQKLTSKPERLPDLGLGEVGAAESNATLVELEDASGVELASLVIGNTKWGAMPGASQSLYVRRSDENQAWEVRASASPSTTVSSWQTRDIMNISPTRVRRMNVKLDDRVSFEMERPESPTDSFNIRNVSEGWRVRETVAGDRTIAGFLQSLTLEDVRRAEGFFEGLGSESLLVTQTFDGLVVDAAIRKDGEKAFAVLSARFDEALRDKVESIPAPEAGEESPLKTAEEVMAEVEEINRLTSGWAYALPQWKFSGIERAATTTVLEEIPEEALAFQILISWEGAPQSSVTGRSKEEAFELATSLRTRLEEEGYGGFGDLAREFSNDAETAAEGGFVGEVEGEDMTPEFMEAYQNLTVGEVSGVVETPFGYTIIRKVSAD